VDKNIIKIPLMAKVIIIILIIDAVVNLIFLASYFFIADSISKSAVDILGDIICTVAIVSFLPLGILFLQRNKKGLYISNMLKVWLFGVTIFAVWGNVDPQFHDSISMEAAGSAGRIGRLIGLLISWFIVKKINDYFGSSKIQGLFVEKYFNESPSGQRIRDLITEESMLEMSIDYPQIKVYAPLYSSEKLKERSGWIAVRTDNRIITDSGFAEDIINGQERGLIDDVTGDIVITNTGKKFCELYSIRKKSYDFIDIREWSFFVDEIKNAIIENRKSSNNYSILEGECINGSGKIKFNTGTLKDIIYEGEFKDGIVHGNGRIVMNDGSVIDGEFWKGFLTRTTGPVELSRDIIDSLGFIGMV